MWQWTWSFVLWGVWAVKGTVLSCSVHAFTGGVGVECHCRVCIAAQGTDSRHFLTLTWWVCLQLFFDFSFSCHDGCWTAQSSAASRSASALYMWSHRNDFFFFLRYWVTEYLKPCDCLLVFILTANQRKSNTVISVVIFELKLALLVLKFGLLYMFEYSFKVGTSYSLSWSISMCEAMSVFASLWMRWTG